MACGFMIFDEKTYLGMMMVKDDLYIHFGMI
jgi:hypothetical protein